MERLDLCLSLPRWDSLQMGLTVTERNDAFRNPELSQSALVVSSRFLRRVLVPAEETSLQLM